MNSNILNASSRLLQGKQLISPEWNIICKKPSTPQYYRAHHNPTVSNFNRSHRKSILFSTGTEPTENYCIPVPQAKPAFTFAIEEMLSSREKGEKEERWRKKLDVEIARSMDKDGQGAM